VLKRLLVLVALFFLVLQSSITPVKSKEVDSYELFWPLVAGKTAGDSWYFLKTSKEKVRGSFIFGNVQKADYMVLLATKRILEAEKLVSEKKFELADWTLNQSLFNLNKALISIKKAGGEKTVFQNRAANVVNRLNNLNEFLPYLTEKSDSNKEILNQISSKVKEVISVLQ